MTASDATLRERITVVVQGVLDARCPNHPADYGGCTDCSPVAEEITDALVAALAATVPDTRKPCPDCNGDGATYEQVRVGQTSTPFVCQTCDGDGATVPDTHTDLMEQGRRLASERDDLIAGGADPAELAMPLAPDTRPAQPERCPECAGTDGNHGVVHTRYDNGGGGNRPCSLDPTARSDAASDREPSCPLCGADVYLIRSYSHIVESGTQPGIDAGDAIVDSWEVGCENDHRLDSGCREGDGRSAVVGWRSAQVLGGAR